MHDLLATESCYHVSMSLSLLTLNLYTIFFYNIDFSVEKIIEIFNSDLANNYGNLLQRVTTPNLRPPGMDLKICTDLFLLSEGGAGDDAELLRSLCCLPEVVRSCNEEYRFSQGIQAVLNCLQLVRETVGIDKTVIF